MSQSQRAIVHGGSGLGERMCAHDRSRTAIGPVET